MSSCAMICQQFVCLFMRMHEKRRLNGHNDEGTSDITKYLSSINT